ncbi:hypothetical protein NW754_005656 [Fusarium falciforme]|uniref:Helicase C-terminal domain-containing protein n=1 Tax=Fusarium falciforme TaxID=195108 RepID=A0A9W8R2P7_9HYPO|nr:hypothetical protein NW754_005656 [Fusarium falciforme]KAJ4185181.1 hypothetical protein NW755_008625 [Fusarium falciforme]KAJ4251097.1 hypothetical protein NW757_006642 [Fusarium falciforme]
MPPNPPWTTITHPWGKEMVWTSGSESDAFFAKVLQDEAMEKKIPHEIQTISQFKAKGERVLVYIRDAEAEKLTNAEMRKAGLKSVDFCHMSSTERPTAIRKFNDEKHSDIDVFITSFGRGADGGNFHGACHVGILFQYPDDIQTMMTVQRSFHHIGMKHNTVWVASHIDDTFDSHEQCQLAWQEAKIITESSPQEYEAISGQKIPEIHQSITGQHRLICAFEIVRSLRMGMISCYPRIRMRWPNMVAPEAMTAGHFYAAVGRFLMANPATTRLFTRAIMERIASTWELGTEISMARIVGNCPALPNPVTIYNYVENGKGEDML